MMVRLEIGVLHLPSAKPSVVGETRVEDTTVEWPTTNQRSHSGQLDKYYCAVVLYVATPGYG
jgi:hypothetical protein